jgi:hypothetical protein
MSIQNTHKTMEENYGITKSMPKRSYAIVVSWVALFISLIVSALVSLRLGQDVSWDLRNYHIYNGYAYLTRRFFYDFAPAQLQTFFNPLLHILSFSIRAHCTPIASAVFLGALQGVNIFLVFQISQILFQRWELRWRTLLSAANAVAGFYAVVNIGELGTTFGDNMVSIPMLGGILLLIRYFMSDDSQRKIPIWHLGVSGILMGAALGLKLTVVIYILGIAVAFPLAMLMPPRRLRPTLLVAFWGGILAGFLAGYGMWGIELYKAYHNPFFPLFNNIFRSPFYEFQNSMDVRYIPHMWQKIFFYPFFFAQKTCLASEQMHRDMRWALCYIALLLLAGFSLYRICRKIRRTDAEASMREIQCLMLLTLFVSISYVSWQYLFSMYRYLSVLEWIAPIFLASTIAYFFRFPKRALIISLPINLMICLSVFPYDNGRTGYEHDFLKVEIPPIPLLDKYLVLMAGSEPTSYIIHQFPPSTRFVRVFANWMEPGRNTKLDQQIHEFIAQYDISRILLYCATDEEVQVANSTLYPLGISKNSRPCRELGSPLGHKGFLCEVKPGVNPEWAPQSILMTFTALKSGVQSNANPPVVRVGKDTIVFHIAGLSARAIDVLCTLDGRELPPQRNWALTSSGEIRMKVGLSTQKGLYHFIGVRDSDESDPNRWIEIDNFIQIH